LIKIICLIENSVYKRDLISEHGLSLYIKKDKNELLFDTGQSGLFIKNSYTLNIKPEAIPSIIISHGHYDHIGGLKKLELKNNQKVYIHPKGIQEKYTIKNNKPKYSGLPKKIIKKNINFVFNTKKKEIFEDIFISGKIKRKDGNYCPAGNFYLDKNGQKHDNMEDEQYLLIKSKQGPVIISGCSHSGLKNILEDAEIKFNIKDAYMIIGGLHLINASKNLLEQTYLTLKKYKVKKISLCHCTGPKGIYYLKKHFSKQAFNFNTGDSIEF